MDFTKLPIAFACVAANSETGKEIILNNGSLPTAMFASMAVPSVFQYPEREGLILIDGGVLNNFPVDVAKKMGADIIIGVDISEEFNERDKIKSIQNVFGQLIGFLDQGKDSVNARLCDLIIKPDITGSSFPLFKGTMAGGAPYSQYFDFHIPFIGLSPVNLVDRFALSGLIGLRFRLSEKHYISFLTNALYESSDIFSSSKGSVIWGGGIDYAVKTFFGPIDLLAGYSNAVKAPTFSANFGYWF
jgi:hypothetical protein